MRLPLLLLSAALIAVPAAAQREAAALPEDVRVNQLILYGDDECPPSTEEEINVCAKLPEEERFRIPSNLRNNPDDPASQSWANRATELSVVGRTGIGSCSPTGPGGFLGCQQQLINAARAERRGGEQVNWNALIEQARQERLSRIDEEARQAEELDPE